jgi:hypothetical protein
VSEGQQSDRLQWGDSPRDVDDINMLLLNAFHSPANKISIWGQFPLGVNHVLLQLVLTTSRWVWVANVDDATRDTLRRALSQKECMIQVLAMNLNDDARFDDAFAVNTSLRHVGFGSSYQPGLVASGCKSKTIQHFQETSGHVPVTDIKTMIAMPSVRSILISSVHATSEVLDYARVLWPDCDVVHSTSQCTIMRHKHTMWFDAHERVYVLYECLECVLPTCVIDDIVTRMCERNAGGCRVS